MRRVTVFAATAIAVVIGMAGLAFGVSTPGYTPANQDCSPMADSTINDHTAEPGCHAFKINVSGGDERIAEFGIDQVPDGNSDISYGLGGVAAPGRVASPHSGCFAVNTAGTGGGEAANDGVGCGANPDGLGFWGTYDINPLFGPIADFLFGPEGDAACRADRPLPSTDPACHPVPSGVPSDPSFTFTPETGSDVSALQAALTDFHYYMGADDNLDAGEHDGVDGMNGTSDLPNGPSDGGAIIINWHPLEAAAWIGALTAGDTTYLLENPLPIADAAFGSCADSICATATTRQQDVYNGTGDNGRTRQVADYSGKDFDPDNCSSGSPSDEMNCIDAAHPDGMNDYRREEADHVVAEPGIQYYEDPDPQGSPISPVPHTAAYVGTCGVILGGGYLPLPFGNPTPTQAPPSPLTNSAGQLQINTCK